MFLHTRGRRLQALDERPDSSLGGQVRTAAAASADKRAEEDDDKQVGGRNRRLRNACPAAAAQPGTDVPATELPIDDMMYVACERLRCDRPTDPRAMQRRELGLRASSRTVKAAGRRQKACTCPPCSGCSRGAWCQGRRCCGKGLPQDAWDVHGCACPPLCVCRGVRGGLAPAALMGTSTPNSQFWPKSSLLGAALEALATSVHER